MGLGKLHSFFINVDLKLLSKDDLKELESNLKITSGKIVRIRMNLRGAILFDILDGDVIISILTFGDRLRDNKQEFFRFDANHAAEFKRKYNFDVIEEALIIYYEQLENNDPL